MSESSRLCLRGPELLDSSLQMNSVVTVTGSVMEKTFRQWKKQSLNKLDHSKKGTVDEDIQHVVSLLNSREEYFTTSSCSGRIVLIDGVREAGLRAGL